MRSSACLLIALIAMGLAACGSSTSPEQEVRDAVTSAHQAAKDKDYKAFCGSIDKKSLQQLEKLGGCEKLFEGEDGTVDKLDITKVVVTGDKATVTAKGEKDPLELLREGGEWKISLSLD